MQMQAFKIWVTFSLPFHGQGRSNVKSNSAIWLPIYNFLLLYNKIYGLSQFFHGIPGVENEWPWIGF